ncbi:MAG: TolC family protein [Chitinophagia bacterium]|nr:TolC family protein [Chitinophagia bacterium]
MNRSAAQYIVAIMATVLWAGACKIPLVTVRKEDAGVPAAYGSPGDTTNLGATSWRSYFEDPYLSALIDTALKYNQELNIARQEIEMSRNEVMARKGEYMPFLNLRGGAAVERAGKYTWDGISEEDLKVSPDKGPKYIGDFLAGGYFSWELDVWKKLRNATKAASLRYLSSREGRNFAVTQVVAEIASSYYELMALDNLLDIIQRNIDLQTSALDIVKLEKNAAKVSQLAVNRFEAQLLNTRNLQYEVRQRIVEAENRIHFLTGRFPGRLPRDSKGFTALGPGRFSAGVPSQLLTNRPDIRQAELQLAAAKLDVQSARANFYPNFTLTAGLGFQSFNPAFLVRPESILYNLAGDMVAPLVNRNAIKATYLNANARQLQLVYEYERSILNAHIEVVNQLSMIDNYGKSYEAKAREVEILDESINISNKLFRSARADYIEVLLTQREALDSRIELVEIKLRQMLARVAIYKALGGGWR